MLKKVRYFFCLFSVVFITVGSFSEVEVIQNIIVKSKSFSRPFLIKVKILKMKKKTFDFFFEIEIFFSFYTMTLVLNYYAFFVQSSVLSFFWCR